ncbi:MAG TPA: GIY-YIG nuclease family protein [Chryseolinea sp.]|nr:GIY-YIG nuclease family protein [Chryseolinea sp.]
MIATFYILFDKFYIVHTTEPIYERLRKHNSDHEGFTGKCRDWVIIYSEKYDTKELAYAQEWEVKKWKIEK